MGLEVEKERKIEVPAPVEPPPLVEPAETPVEEPVPG